MSSLPARLLIAGALAASVSCSATPIEVRGTLAGPERVDVIVTIPAGHESERERYIYAALTTVKILNAWLPPFMDRSLSVTPAPTRWWTDPAAMAPEYAVAREVTRAYWERAIDIRSLPPSFVDGLVEYCARRAVSKIVDERYLAVYRSRAELRYFAGFVPRGLRVALRVEDEGDPVDEYRARPRGQDAGALGAKAFLTLGTLERWVGRPVFDEIIAELARMGGQPSLADVAALASRVSGQDLTWFFDQTFGSVGVIDYGVASFSSAVHDGGQYDTQIIVRRFGDGIFTGASLVPGDSFEHGRAIVVETTFANGEKVRDTWDGRGDVKTFRYRSPTRAISAEVDPDRVLLLDLNRDNNGVTFDAAAAQSAASRWSARWMIWLEDALLTYVAFT